MISVPGGTSSILKTYLSMKSLMGSFSAVINAILELVEHFICYLVPTPFRMKVKPLSRLAHGEMVPIRERVEIPLVGNFLVESCVPSGIDQESTAPFPGVT